ncbi:MAG: oligosaccharide flippase family protein, partial [Rubrivivax sp.]|nr:oligosaccharide flippase family protein [Rubrivivax sp.]
MTDGGHYSVRKIRSSAGYFLFGKVASALLTMLAFGITARLLGWAEYGAYAALLAATELLMGLCTLGLDWTTGRYLPEYRSRASRAQVSAFLAASFAFQAGCMVVAAAIALLLADRLALLLATPQVAAVMLFALVLVLEGSARIVRDQFLALLVAQGAAQLATLCRSLTLVALLGAMLVWPPASAGHLLVWVVGAEVVAAGVSLLVGVVALALIVRGHQPDVMTAATPAWVPPRLAAMAALARNAFASTLLVLCAGGPMLTLVIGSLAGPQAAGAFGFARGLVDQVRRFLPIELFLSLIRAGVVARYVASRDFAALNFQMALVFAVSVAAAMPVIAMFAGHGGSVAAAIGGDGFRSVGPVLALWSASLLLFPHRRTVELVAYTTERSSACITGGLALALAPALVAALLAAGVALPWALVGALVADVGFSVVVALRLRSSGLPYRWSGTTLARLMIYQCVAVAAIWLLPTASAAWLDLSAAGLLALLLTWGFAAWHKPFSTAERAAIN